jgi:hypothetical protein
MGYAAHCVAMEVRAGAHLVLLFVKRRRRLHAVRTHSAQIKKHHIFTQPP